jgi:hypothetical protein
MPANESERWERLRNRWLLAALAAPLVVFPWSYDATDLPKLVYLRLVAIGLVLVGLFTRSRSAWASSQESKISSIHPLRLPLLLLLAAMGASALQSLDPWFSLASLTDWIMLVFFVFAFSGAARDGEFQRKAVGVMAGVGGICAAWAFLQLAVPGPINGAARSGGAATGPFASPTILAGYLGAVFPLAFWSAMQFRSGARGLWRLAPSILIFAALAVLGQKVPLLAAGAGGLLVALTARRVDFPPSFRRWAGIGISLALPLAGLLSSKTAYPPGYLSELRRISWKMAQARPIFGWGPGTFGLFAPRFTTLESAVYYVPNRPPYPSPHNEALSILTSGGRLALAAYLGVLFVAGGLLVRRLTGVSRKRRTAGGADSASAEGVPDSDRALAAAWLGFLAAWLIQSWRTPQSVGAQAPFWMALGMASASAFNGAAPACADWPKPLRWAGAFAAFLLLIPLPSPEWSFVFKKGFNSAALFTSDLASGPGVAVRWLAGDVYYARAVRARERGDWDAAFKDHISSLVWAPTRMGNWMGYGETAYEGSQKAKKRPFDWYEFGGMGYARAEKMEPVNGFLFYGDARLMAAAVRNGGKSYAKDAEKGFRTAIELYPGLWHFHLEYGLFLENQGRKEEAVSQFQDALRLDPGNRDALAGLRRESGGTE